MKYILVIGDGMADNPVEALGGKTPLQVSNIPTIHKMASKGVVGHTINCPKPLPAGSETAILYRPFSHGSGCFRYPSCSR